MVKTPNHAKGKYHADHLPVTVTLRAPRKLRPLWEEWKKWKEWLRDHPDYNDDDDEWKDIKNPQSGIIMIGIWEFGRKFPEWAKSGVDKPLDEFLTVSRVACPPRANPY